MTSSSYESHHEQQAREHLHAAVRMAWLSGFCLGMALTIVGGIVWYNMR